MFPEGCWSNEPSMVEGIESEYTFATHSFIGQLPNFSVFLYLRGDFLMGMITELLQSSHGIGSKSFINEENCYQVLFGGQTQE